MKPLPARIRPDTLGDFLGQEETVERLRRAARAGQPPSAIFWGPPGSGKTTLALLLAGEYNLPLRTLSATVDGIPRLREILSEELPAVLFVDEIHRWNRAQQDALLPHVEEGSVVLLGATTENPGRSINRALLSRAELFRLDPLSEDNILRILRRGLRESGKELPGEDLQRIAAWAEGDARRALRALEEVVLGEVETSSLLQRMPALGDREEHYHLASAFIKSMRGGDARAALYWLARMESGGEDPRFVARRMVIFASEDVGLARSGAVAIAESIASAAERVGEPECWILLAHGAFYLAECPKSRRSWQLLEDSRALVQSRPHYPVPSHLRQGNSVTRQWGDGEGYDEKATDGFLPPELA